MGEVSCEVCGHRVFLDKDPETRVLHETLQFVGDRVTSMREELSKLEDDVEKVFLAYPGMGAGG